MHDCKGMSFLVRTAVAVVVLSALTVFARAEDVYSALYENIGADELLEQLPADVHTALDGYAVSDDASLGDGMGIILGQVSEKTGGILRSALSAAAVTAAAALLCALASNVFTAAGGSTSQVVMLAGTAAITAAAMLNAGAMIGGAREAVASMDVFSKGLLSALAASSSLTGEPVSAAMKYAAAVFFSDIAITLMDRLLIPVVYAYIAVSAVSAALGEDMLDGLASFLKWLCITVTSLLVSSFVIYVTTAGIITSTSDAATIKAAKLVISNSVPVLGSILTDAADTVLSGARLLRASIGAVGLIAVILICLVPFLKSGIHYIVFRLTAAASSVMGEKRLTRLIENLATAFGMILGITATMAIIEFVAIISAMKSLVS
jgi:stage III sporulation protein AE